MGRRKTSRLGDLAALGEFSVVRVTRVDVWRGSVRVTGAERGRALPTFLHGDRKILKTLLPIILIEFAGFIISSYKTDFTTCFPAALTEP